MLSVTYLKGETQSGELKKARGSTIVITPKGRLTGMIPHFLFINGQLPGVIKGRKPHISLPSEADTRVTLCSVHRFSGRPQQVVCVPAGETGRLAFADGVKVCS